MELTPSELTIDYPFLRLVSENQIWEFGIGQLTITGGVRIVAGKVGSEEFEITYWAGEDKGMAMGILAQAMTIIRALPESISDGDFKKAFPTQTRRPMINDPECWDALCKAANIMTPKNYQMILDLQENFPGVEE